MNVHSSAITVSLGEVAAINPKGPLPGELGSDEACDFLPMARLSEDGTTDAAQQRPYSEVAKGYTPFKHGDVLLAKITPCFENNKIAVASIESDWAFGSTEFHVIRPARCLDARYVAHFLRQDAVRNAGEKRMTGSGGQRRVPRAFLEELRVPLPPLDEQKRIAAILDQADALRCLRRRALDRLNTLGQAIFRQMFLDGRATAPLSALGEINPKRRFDGNTEFAVTFLPMAAVGEDARVLYQETRALSEVRKGFTYFERGDILVAKITPCFENGKGCLTSEIEHQIGFGSTEFHVIRPSHEELGTFLHLIVQSSEFRKIGEQSMTGSAGQKRVPTDFLRAYRVPVPRPDELRLLSARIKAVKSALEVHRRAAERCDCLFTSLQHRAFRGEL